MGWDYTKISGSSTSTGSFGRVEATTIGGTLTTAAQTNITSLGTLTGLTVSDDVTLSGTTPALRIVDTDAPDTYEMFEISTSDTTINYNTRNSSGGFVSTDHQIGRNASGANTFKWNIGGTRVFELAANKVSGSSTSTGSFGRVESDTFNTTTFNSTEVTSTNLTVTGTITGSSLDVSGDGIFGGNIRAVGDVIAERYIVSSSVTHLTQSFSSGSTIFGDTSDDTHQFTGSLSVSGSNLDVRTDTNTKLRVRRNNHSTAAIELSFRGSTGGLIHATSKELDISTAESGISLLPNNGIVSINDNSTQTVKPGALSIQKISGINYLSIADAVSSAAEGNIFLITGSNGNVGIANQDPQEKLDVTGNIQASGNISGSATSTGSFGMVHAEGIKGLDGTYDGTLLIPGQLAFGADTDSMLRRRTSNDVEFRIAGSDIVRIKPKWFAG